MSAALGRLKLLQYWMILSAMGSSEIISSSRLVLMEEERIPHNQTVHRQIVAGEIQVLSDQGAHDLRKREDESSVLRNDRTASVSSNVAAVFPIFKSFSVSS
ncbi:unnamed protein product [Strongylus vulgaris]|uniref:Uncharacterized protein n=1 Tax=Strongylus vulgaris TaxID=40348 RepID=A0A3P7J791_STRVU|nr:unnamed protein product [Strongylus vulgaris]VDM78249.1 unnamed protein product [Strongylus vulgaris]